MPTTAGIGIFYVFLGLDPPGQFKLTINQLYGLVVGNNF